MMLQITFATVALFAMIRPGQTCSNNSECIYGFCDSDGECRCTLACDLFETDLRDYVCTEGASPNHAVPICEAVSKACRNQKHVDVHTTTEDSLYSAGFLCDNITESEFTGTVMFCEDQGYCNARGICMKDSHLPEPYCRCNSEYEGTRCETRKSMTLNPSLPVSSHPSSRTTARGSSNEKHLTGTFGNPAVNFAAGMITCMISACLVVYSFKKRTRKTDTSSEDNNDEQHNDVEENKSLPSVRRETENLNIKSPLLFNGIFNTSQKGIWAGRSFLPKG